MAPGGPLLLRPASSAASFFCGPLLLPRASSAASFFCRGLLLPRASSAAGFFCRGLRGHLLAPPRPLSNKCSKQVF